MNLYYASLLSECNFLKKMIARCPEGWVISRSSLEARLKSVQKEIEELDDSKETINDETINAECD
jgi:hypothetical protein